MSAHDAIRIDADTIVIGVQPRRRDIWKILRGRYQPKVTYSHRLRSAAPPDLACVLAGLDTDRARHIARQMFFGNEGA